LRHVRSTPNVLDGEPISDVLPLGGVVDRYRRLTIDRRPVATDAAAVGDACACTNPSNGRGLTLGLIHPQRLREVIRSHLDDPREFAAAWDNATQAELTPWYRETVEEDRARINEIDTCAAGSSPSRRAPHQRSFGKRCWPPPRAIPMPSGRT
jgi:flavin-dependent dehydrogenase